MVALIAIVIIAAVTLLGGNLRNLFQRAAHHHLVHGRGSATRPVAGPLPVVDPHQRTAHRRQHLGQVGRPPPPKGTPMLQFLFTLQSFVADRVEASKDRGATAVEYGLMVALIAIVIIAAVTLLGGNLRDLFQQAATTI